MNENTETPNDPEVPAGSESTDSAVETNTSSVGADATAVEQGNSTAHLDSAGPQAPESAALASPSAPAAAPGAAPGAPSGVPPAFAAHRTPASPPTPSAKPSRRFGTTALVTMAAVAALVGGVSGAGVSVLALTSGQNSSNTASSSNPQSTITVNDAADATLITAIAASAGPSVVTISVQGSTASGTGSGVILTEDGYILTNTHVVTLDGEASSATISVETYDGHLYSAKLVGTDPITDLAVIKIESSSAFAALQFADSSLLNVGDTAVAIGAPLGLSNTVTNGIVSALNRSITVASSAVPTDGTDQTPDSEENGGTGPFNFWEFPGEGDTSEQQTPTAAQQASIYLPVIQTDAAINPGNSGGALLDSDGKVIGINVAIAGTGSTTSEQSGSIGVGFAIPSNLAKRIAFEIIDTGTASHALLGATVMDVTSDSAITNKTVVGASVQSVTTGGGAANAGIRKGDIITSFNGLPITGANDLTAQVRATAADSTVQVTFLRGDSSQTVTVTLGELQ